MFSKLTRIALPSIGALLISAVVQSASAQPNTTAQPNTKAQPKGAAQPNTTTDPAPKKTDEGSPDKSDANRSEQLTQEFNAKLDEWKEILKQMRVVKEKFATADQAEATKLTAEWNGLTEKGRALIPVLGDLASKAYDAAPEQDFSIVRFLVKVLFDYVSHDHFEKGLELADMMIKHDTESVGVYSLAGIAAFSINDFEKTAEYLTKAKEKNGLTPQATGILDQIEDYKVWWKQEQEIRAKEAEADDLPRVLITTSQGEIEVELFENEAPQTVANFISLVEAKFYDGLTFHRVLPGFMAQGGCPKGDGTGGPEYNIYCECDPKDHPNFRRHFRGTLSMAHAGKNTGGSQFFMTFSPQNPLDERHTAFGRIVKGMEVLAKIQRRNPTDENGLPVPAAKLPTPDKIVSATVLRKRDHEYVPTKVED